MNKYKIISVIFLMTSTPYGSYALGDGKYSELNSLQHKNISRPTDKGFDDNKRGMLGITDDFSNFFQTTTNHSNFITRIEELDQKEYQTSPFLNVGWNYYSFSTKVGGAATRRNYLEMDSWIERYDYFKSHNTESYIQDNKINELSPIEKYEYLIGAKEFKLTHKEWEKGLSLYKKYQKVPAWAGACHGTAPAVLNSPEPQKDIVITSADGERSVSFTRKELKVLIAYVWAHNPAPISMLGQRCNYPLNTPRYNQTSSCFDTNPGSFHLAITNFVKGENRSLIIDTSPGSEVWNRPVLSYSYQYMNPISKRPTSKLKQAMIDIKKYQNDPYKDKRAKDAKSLVGVWMKVVLLSDSDLGEDTPDELNTTEIEFVYDLEINNQGRIIGGEWLNQQHPDFLWINNTGTQPMTLYDRIWRRSNSNSYITDQIPKNLNEAALRSHKNDSISYYFVEYLTLLARIL